MGRMTVIDMSQMKGNKIQFKIIEEQNPDLEAGQDLVLLQEVR